MAAKEKRTPERGGPGRDVKSEPSHSGYTSEPGETTTTRLLPDPKPTPPSLMDELNLFLQRCRDLEQLRQRQAEEASAKGLRQAAKDLRIEARTMGAFVEELERLIDRHEEEWRRYWLEG